MLIANTGQSLVVMNLRTGEQVQLPPGQMTPVLDSKIPFIDDSAVLIALFNAGVLVAYTDAGAAYPGFPTTANLADSKRIPPVDADYAAAVVGAAGGLRGLRGQRGLVLMSRGDYPSMTISDTTNVTYAVVDDGVKISGSASSAYGRIRLNTGRDIRIPGTKLGCDVYVDPTHWAYNAVRTAPNFNLLISPDNVTSGQTNSLRMSVVNANIMPGWNRLSANLDGTSDTEYAAWTLGGTYPSNGVVRYCYVDTTLTTSGDSAIVRQLDIGERGRPIVMFGFDGADYAAQALNQEVIAYMIARNVPGYIAIRTSQITVANAPYLAAAYAAGWDIVQQTNEDVNYSTYNASYPTGADQAAHLLSRWREADAILASRGWDRGRKIFSYPQNGFFAEGNTALLAAGVQIIRVARGTAKNSARGGSMQTPYVNARDMGNSTYAAAFQHWIRSTVDLGNVLMTYAHEVVADATASPTSLQVKVSEIKKAIDLAVALRDTGDCDILCPSQFAADYY